ncbi:hypothetical protein MKX03_034951, partial [Papaver bracteatum]
IHELEAGIMQRIKSDAESSTHVTQMVFRFIQLVHGFSRFLIRIFMKFFGFLVVILS